MIFSHRMIYKGDNTFRLLDPPVEFELDQEFQVQFTPIEFLPDEEEFAPSAEAVERDMGMWHVDDPEFARYLAESEELSEWNQFLYATSDETAE